MKIGNAIVTKTYKNGTRKGYTAFEKVWPDRMFKRERNLSEIQILFLDEAGEPDGALWFQRSQFKTD